MFSAISTPAKLIDGGFAFENEFRSPAEVHPEPTDELTVLNPAYDATPTELLDTVVTDAKMDDC